MGQKKVDVKGTRGSEQGDRLSEKCSSAGIGSALLAFAQIKQQFGGASGLSHLVVLLIGTKVLGATSLLLLSRVVKLFRSSFWPSSAHGLALPGKNPD